MFNPRIRDIGSPLTPMAQAAFSFSPNAMQRFMETAKYGLPTPPIFKSMRNTTPDFPSISSLKLSPIDNALESLPQKLSSESNPEVANMITETKIDLKKISNISRDGDILTPSNANKRDLAIILENLGLKQYSTLFVMKEVDDLLLLNDENLENIGMSDSSHREILLKEIYKFTKGKND